MTPPLPPRPRPSRSPSPHPIHLKEKKVSNHNCIGIVRMLRRALPLHIKNRKRKTKITVPNASIYPFVSFIKSKPSLPSTTPRTKQKKSQKKQNRRKKEQGKLCVCGDDRLLFFLSCAKNPLIHPMQTPQKTTPYLESWCGKKKTGVSRRGKKGEEKITAMTW
jgi:hypothetical protein